MRLAATLATLALLGPLPARAVTPDAFRGTWVVERMAGASDVGTAEDYRKLLGTRVRWTVTEVASANGVCPIIHATVTPVSNDILEHSVWGGQTIAGLDLPKAVVASAFGRNRKPVFDDGGKGCAHAVMLRADRILFMFGNGYLYLLNRARR